ncbi:hypothetical protein PV326_011065, partial [Microctonus aethiopoides]
NSYENIIMNCKDDDLSFNHSSDSLELFTPTDYEDVIYTEDEIFIKDKLIEWDLHEYVDIFKCQKIDKYVFLHMSNGTVEKLMPSIGHSQKFILKRKELLSDRNRNKVTNVRQHGQELRELLEETPLNFISSKQSLDPARKNDISKAYALQKDVNKKDPKSIELENLMICKLEKLKTCTELNDDTLHLWADTFNLRKQSKLLPTELFKSYHLLEPPTGAKLIFQDFASTATEINANALVDIWPELCLKIIFIAIKQKPKFLQLISQYKDNFNVTNASTIAWRVLPLLFLPTSKITSLKKKSIEISYQEQSDGFIRWIGNITEIESEIIANYNSRMLKYGLNTQPYIIAVGPADKLIAAYCIIDGKKYLFNDVTLAVDLTWKAIIALDLEYSTINTAKSGNTDNDNNTSKNN